MLKFFLHIWCTQMAIVDWPKCILENDRLFPYAIWKWTERRIERALRGGNKREKDAEMPPLLSFSVSSLSCRDSGPFLCPCESEQWDVWASEGAAHRILALSSSWSLTLINESADMGRMLRKAPEDLRGVKGGRGYGRWRKNTGPPQEGRGEGPRPGHNSPLTDRKDTFTHGQMSLKSKNSETSESE